MSDVVTVVTTCGPDATPAALAAAISEPLPEATSVSDQTPGASAATLANRETGLRTKWMGGPKHDWHSTGKVAASCIVAGAGMHRDVICHANENAMGRKSPNVLFCPTHSAVVALTPERYSRLPHHAPASSSNDAGESATARKIAKVLGSAFLSCTSTAILARCALQYWCVVTKKMVASAIKGCQTHLPDQQAVSDNDATALVTYNVVFRCLLPKVASHHRQGGSDVE